MKTIFHVLALTSFMASALAQTVSIPDPGLNAAIREALQKPTGPLTEQDLLSLSDLAAGNRGIRHVDGLEAARNLFSLDLSVNQITNFSLPSALKNLIVLDVSFNPLTNCALPSGLSNMTALFLEGTSLRHLTLPAGLIWLQELHLSGNQFPSFSLPADMTNLLAVDLAFNQLTNLIVPRELTALRGLELEENRLTSLILSSNLTRLGSLILRGNQLTNLVVPASLTNLTFVDLRGNQLARLILPPALPQLSFLHLGDNQLTDLVLPLAMTNLSVLFLGNNQLTNLTLSSGLSNLVQLDLRGNDLASLTLPPDLTKLSLLLLDGNPLGTFVLSEPMAATQLAGVVASLRNQGVSVFTYPLAIELVRPRQLTGAFQIGITGPPGVYGVFGSTDLATWSEFGFATNALGSIVFTDVTAHSFQKRFYRALRHEPPVNMVFIPPNTFTMGSPTNELHRDSNEGPQTTVTLTRGFWIGKYEVTQDEYLSVTGTNLSQFPGDLSRPVSSVSWPDATNYCWLLTQRELAAGRIPSGSQYRLPTEAEWECAARAGTSTRFSYGDDPDYTSLTNYAWQNFEDGLTVHPVGQKLPNPWGLYDLAGNVFEWCQDWLGPLPGGFVADPQGPPSNPIGWKIMRGGAFDFGGPACRSASRMFFGNHPALTDWNLGFRVVLVISPQ